MDPSVVPASDDAPEADLLLGPGLTRADFYCGRYRISADVYTGHRRLVELLRDVNRQYLDVRRLRVTALDGQDPTAEYGEGLLTKTEIDWVGIRAEPPRSEARLYGYVKKTPLRAALVLRTCRIEGTIHVDSGATDPVVFFLRGLEKTSERFLAVTGATVAPAPDRSAANLGLAIVNRGAVRLFSALR